MISVDPATGDAIWEGTAADAAACAAAVAQARAAVPEWAATPLDDRVACLRRYAELLRQRSDVIAVDIARETGKPLWEARAELASMVGKVELSIAAHAERTGTRESPTGFGRAVLRHRPHGVMLVLGPYNFPGHLPNGHIVPALLAGNTVVFKPSEETPLTGEHLAAALRDADLPTGAFVLVQGTRETGAALVEQDIDGLLFTGSAAAGAHFRRRFADRPDVILALELGGNNPVVAWDGDPQAAASIIVASAFITTGQRCSCARRLIIPDGVQGDRIVEAVVGLADRVIIGAWNDAPEPFMGPLVSAAAARRVATQVDQLRHLGAREIRPLGSLEARTPAFVRPAILDVTGLTVPDEEIFGPVLQISRVCDFETAITAANATRFGLSAGLISQADELWQRFVAGARAGVINRNRPTTGAAGSMPFGGLGASGNHRPSAYYAADYCAWPVASFEAPAVVDQQAELRGIAA